MWQQGMLRWGQAMGEFRFGDAMSLWWRLSLSRYWPALGISLVFVIAATLIIFIGAGAIGYSAASSDPRAIGAGLLRFFSSGSGILMIFLALIFFLFVLSWMMAAHCALADGEMRGSRTGMGSALARSWTRMVSVAGSNFLAAMLLCIAALPGGIVIAASAGMARGGLLAPLVLILGAVIALVGVAIVSTIYLLAATAAVVEELPAVDSLRRSSELTAGHRWAVFGVYFLVTALVSLATNIPEGFINMIVNKQTGSLAGGVLSLLALPFSSFLAPAIFYTLREAREGRSIEVANVFS